jgi:hypothetical protein
MELIEQKKAFKNWDIGRLHLNFPNGNHLSTVWADGTYSDNNMSMTVTDWLLSNTGKTPVPTVESNTVEIMFSCGEKLRKKILKKYNEGDDDPIGYLTFDQWLEIVNLLSREKKENITS